MQREGRELRILVTGGAGFIGSHLVEQLCLEGYRSFTVVDNLHRGRTENLASCWNHIQFVRVDIRDRHTLGRLMRGIDVVFHLAAQSNVMGACTNLGYSASTNIAGTLGILEAGRQNGVRRVVFTSSREVYGDPSSLPVAEAAPLAPKNAYGTSKVAGEMCCAMLAGSGLETVVLRLANVYGPRDHDRVIPCFLENALTGRALTLYGGDQILDFIWIDWVVAALLRVGLGGHVAGPINIGSGEGTSIAELARHILKLTNSTSDLRLLPSRASEVVRFVADTTRAKQVLGINPDHKSLFWLPDLIVWTKRHLATSVSSHLTRIPA